MKWWQWAFIIVYHVVLIYAFGSQIKGSPLF
jgi:hypothetical protein